MNIRRQRLQVPGIGLGLAGAGGAAFGDDDHRAVRSLIEVLAAPFRAVLGCELPGSVINVPAS